LKKKLFEKKPIKNSQLKPICMVGQIFEKQIYLYFWHKYNLCKCRLSRKKCW